MIFGDFEIFEVFVYRTVVADSLKVLDSVFFRMTQNDSFSPRPIGLGFDWVILSHSKKYWLILKIKIFTRDLNFKILF